MNASIGEGETRERQRALAGRLSAARGRDLRRLVSMIGEAALVGAGG
jgi:vacuolar-type H+-ATPase subunit B/Vma2